MRSLRLILALLTLAALTLALTGPGGALADEDDDDRACTWVGDTEVCVPPR